MNASRHDSLVARPSVLFDALSIGARADEAAVWALIAAVRGVERDVPAALRREIVDFGARRRRGLVTLDTLGDQLAEEWELRRSGSS